MALQDIFRALDEQADAECKEILDNAKTQAKAIVTEAKEEADRIRQRKIDAVEGIVGARASHIVNAARLENKRDIAALKEKAIDTTFDDARGTLAGLRDKGGYEDLFRRLADEALAGVTEPVSVQVDPRDEQVARKVLDATGADYTLDPSIAAAGGLVAVLGEGRIYRRNTFDDRLDKVRHVAQSQVAEIIFG
jgi:vacuolar-type H+-ATPase subunit E/Vma4